MLLLLMMMIMMMVFALVLLLCVYYCRERCSCTYQPRYVMPYRHFFPGHGGAAPAGCSIQGADAAGDGVTVSGTVDSAVVISYSVDPGVRFGTDLVE